MAMSDTPGLLVVKAFCPHAQFVAFVSAAAGVVSSAGGIVLTARPLHAVVAVEPGSVPAHLWIGQFPSPAKAEAAWQALSPVASTTGLHMGKPATVLCMAGVPDEGLGDFIPTKANVPVRPSYQTPVLLLIEGTGHDQTRMDQYRDIILPMMRDRGSYYAAFELGGNIKVLSGAWSEAIFAISVWPSVGHALDFWLAKQYQHDAIPLRIDVGAFSVLAVEANA
jgi:uncharacterized protein (DUF1330 family)